MLVQEEPMRHLNTSTLVQFFLNCVIREMRTSLLAILDMKQVHGVYMTSIRKCDYHYR